MGLFGDLLSGITGGLVGGVMDYNIAKQNLASQEAWNERNLQFQREGFEWQKSEANLTREREDTAIQRRTADLQAAGLNPLLAAGSPASASTPVSTPIVPQGKAPQMKGFSVLDSVQVAQALRLGSAQVGRVQAENDLIKQQARSAAAKADVDEMDARIARDDYMNPSSESLRTLRGHKAFLDVEMVNRKAGLATAQMVAEQARAKNIDAATVKQDLETAIRDRDFTALKNLGVMDDRGDVAKRWMDIAVLAGKGAADVDIGANEALDILKKLLGTILGNR